MHFFRKAERKNGFQSFLIHNYIPLQKYVGYRFSKRDHFTSEVCERRPEFILLCRFIYSTGCFSFLIIFRQLRNNTSLLDVQRPGWLRIWRRETALDGKYWMFNSIIHSFGIVYLLGIVICEYLTFSVEVSIFSSSTVHVVNSKKMDNWTSNSDISGFEYRMFFLLFYVKEI